MTAASLFTRSHDFAVPVPEKSIDTIQSQSSDIIRFVRVIGGIHRGRRLSTVKGFDVRPTSDRLRETLFNILAPDVLGSRFLDICAGSGAVGIEASSRGAR